MPGFFSADVLLIKAEWPLACALVTVFYTFAHIFPFSFLRCYVFRHYLRYASRTVALGAILIALFECAVQILYGNIFSTRIGFVFHFIYFLYFCMMIRVPFLKQYALSLPIGVLMFFSHYIAYTVEDHFLRLPIPFLASGIIVLLLAGLYFYPAQKYSEKYIAPLLPDKSLQQIWKPIVFMGTTLLVLSILANPFNEQRSWAAFCARLAALIGSFTCMSIIIYSMNQVIRQKQLNAILAVAHEMRGMEQEHYASIAEIEAKTHVIQRELYDCAVHIQQFLDENKADAIREYSQRFLDSRLSLTSRRVCGNELINAIVSYWQNKFASLQVKSSIRIALGPDNPIDPVHMTAILGNLLRNAFEALARVPDANERRLVMNLRSFEQALVITLDNTFNGELRQDASGCLLSAKRDFSSRGVGLDSINYSVEQYGGTFQTKVSADLFEASVMLPLND